MTTDLIARLDEVYAYDVYGQPTGMKHPACQDAIDALEAQAAEIAELEAHVEALQNKCARRGLSPEDSDALQAENAKLRLDVEDLEQALDEALAAVQEKGDE